MARFGSGPLALLAPTFPTLEALATLTDEPAPSTTSSGLFQGLLKDPQLLLQDLLADPAKYEESVSPLVQDLVSGQKKLEQLTRAESALLDRATIDFAQPARRKVASVPPRAPKSSKPKPRAPVKQKGPSIGGMEAYWWLT